MKYKIVLAVLAMVGCSTLAMAGDSVRAIPKKPVLPDGLGVNIHFKRPRPGEMKMLAEGGFRWVRMDFSWSATERKKGTYDFSEYDHLIAALKPHGIRALFILDYGNQYYDNGLSPHSDAGRAAFARWAAAAATHFRGKGILWEMFNEPNIGFWKPAPNANDYVKLALAVGQALRAAAPGETYIGPATSRIDFDFLEACFRAGLLEYWSAVSVHPYRQQAPETAAPEYARLRHLIAKYAPAGKRIPIISGEWGYSSAWTHMDDARQGRLLPREWLANLANGIPISIWYDWHDDGRDPKEPEHHFGTVNNAYRADRDPVYDPKPSYLAAKTLTTTLAGYTFNKRLDVGNDQVYVLLFAHADDTRVVAWATAKQPIQVVIPASPGAFSVVGHTGDRLEPVTANKKGLQLQLTGDPLYLIPKSHNDLLRIAAACSRLPSAVVTPANDNLHWELTVCNPLAKPIRMRCENGPWITLPPGRQTRFSKKTRLHRADRRKRVTFVCECDPIGTLMQSVRVTASNPLSVRVTPATGNTIRVEIENPSGDSFAGLVNLVDIEGIRVGRSQMRVVMQLGEKRRAVEFACSTDPKNKYLLGARITDEQGEVQAETLVQVFLPLSQFDRLTPATIQTALRLVADGDPKVPSEQSLLAAAPPEGPLVPGSLALEIVYQFDAGWKFVRLVPRGSELQTITGRPAAFGAWIFGDQSGNYFRLRVTDATGQTFQPSGPPLSWRGWRYVQLPLNGDQAGHWGGADDGVVHYPIRWDSIGLIDSARRKKCAGTIYLSRPTLIYDAD